MLNSQMPESMDNIALQAHEGSVAAIIQILNQQLAQRGVRTRAIFEDGILQLLCEASQEEQLEQASLIKEVRQTLEALAPRNSRRVNINSRIVREQQLLWLEEINRDPDNQVLWSQEITLARPNIFKQLLGKSPHQQLIANKKTTDKRQNFCESDIPPLATGREDATLDRDFWGSGFDIIGLRNKLVGLGLVALIQSAGGETNA